MPTMSVHAHTDGVSLAASRGSPSLFFYRFHPVPYDHVERSSERFDRSVRVLDYDSLLPDIQGFNCDLVGVDYDNEFFVHIECDTHGLTFLVWLIPSRCISLRTALFRSPAIASWGVTPRPRNAPP